LFASVGNFWFTMLRNPSQSPSFLWWRVSVGSFALFAFKRKDRLSSGLAFYSKLLNESLEVFSSWVFCMITRRNLSALVDVVLLFELWILIPQIIPHGPAVPPCFTGEGFQSLGLAYLGKPRHLVLWVVDFNPLNYSLADNAILLFESWFSIPRISLFQPAVPQVCMNNGFLRSGRQRRYCNQPWASVPRLAIIQGQQRLSLNLGITSSSPKSGFMLMLTFDTRILVAIYQFGCRMSNTKVSPQLATLDGPVFISRALCRENFHTYGMKSCIDGCIECLTHYWALTW
jgi:hypothetical protein